MPLYVPQIMLALAIVLTAGTGVWLLINARAVPGPRLGRQNPPPPRGVVLTMLIAFNIGWLGSVAIWSWAMTDEAVQVVDAAG